MIVRWEEPCGGMNMLGMTAEFSMFGRTGKAQYNKDYKIQDAIAPYYQSIGGLSVCVRCFAC